MPPASPRPPGPALEEYAPALAISEISESPFNPRHSFDEQKLKELAESIRQKGLLQAIQVRRVKDAYELVFGARRLRAVKMAGLATVAAVVREMSDAVALEVSVVENSQREDVHPLEEADGLRHLVEGDKKRLIPAMPIEEVAAKIGKTATYVYGRLKLCSLAPGARKAYLAGKLSTTIALKVARIPNLKLQDEATRDIVNGVQEDEHGPIEGQPMTDELASKHLAATYMLRLDQAPFDTTDAELVKKAGSCEKCPKRTGNQAALFADVKRKDLCTDPHCFAEKKDADYKRRVEEAKAAGGREIAPGVANKIFRYGNTTPEPGAPYVVLTQMVPEDPQRRTWRELLGKELPPIHIARVEQLGGEEKILECLKKADAYAALRENPRHKWAARAADAVAKDKETKKPAARAAEKVKDEAAEKLRDIVRAEVMRRIVGTAEGDQLSEECWRFLAADMLGHDWAAREVAERRLRQEGDKGKKGDPSLALTKQIGSMSEAIVRGLVVELILYERLAQEWNGYSPTLKAAAKVFDFDLGKMEKQAKQQVEAADAKEGKAPKDAKKQPVPAKEPEAGTCRFCGCSEETPCIGEESGEECAWESKSKRTVCTAPDCLTRLAAEQQ